MMELLYDSEDKLILYGALATAITIFILLRVMLNKYFYFIKILNLPSGPRGWPIIGNLACLGTHPQINLTELAKTYGPLMYLRLGQKDCIVVSSPEMAKEFLKNRDLNFSSRPHMIHADIVHYDSQDIGFQVARPKWRHLRSIFQGELTSLERLEATNHVRREEVDCMLCTIFAQERGVAINLRAQLNIMISNIISRMVLNKRFFNNTVGMSKKGIIIDTATDRDEVQELREFRETIEEIALLLGTFNIGDFIPALAWLDVQGYARRLKKLHKHMDKFITKIIVEHQMRRRQLHGTPIDVSKNDVDMVDVLMEKLEENTSSHQITEGNIKGVIMDAFLVAIGTTTVTIDWTMAEVLRNPSIMKKAQEELDTMVGSSRLVQEFDIPNLKYIQCIGKESLRLHPPIPLLVPHESIEACKSFGYDIPAKTRLVVNVRAIGRDPRTWEDPLMFNPDRFMEGNKYSDINTHGNDFQLLPFGSGRRICPGMQMSNVIVPFVVANLLHSFVWSLPMDPKDLDMSEGMGLTTPRAKALHAIAKPRLPHNLYE